MLCSRCSKMECSQFVWREFINLFREEEKLQEIKKLRKYNFYNIGMKFLYTLV